MPIYSAVNNKFFECNKFNADFNNTTNLIFTALYLMLVKSLWRCIYILLIFVLFLKFIFNLKFSKKLCEIYLRLID